MSPDELIEVVKRAQKGDRDAHGQLYSAFHSMVIGQLINLGLRLDEAEDVCQDSFLQIMKKIHTLQEPKYFSTWIYRVIHNVCVSSIIKSKTHRSFPIDSTIQIQDKKAKKPDSRLSEEDRNAQIRIVLRQLAQIDREMLLACFFLDSRRLYDDLAKLFKVPVGTIKSRLNKARRKFREKAEELGLTEIFLGV